MLLLLRLMRKLRAGVDFILFTTLVYLLVLASMARHSPGGAEFPAGAGHSCAHSTRPAPAPKNRKRLPARYILIANHPSAFEDMHNRAVRRGIARQAAGPGRGSHRRPDQQGRPARSSGPRMILARGTRPFRPWWTPSIRGRTSPSTRRSCKGGALQGVQVRRFRVSIRTGIPILPLFLHYEHRDDFECSLPTAAAQNLALYGHLEHRANYYVYDLRTPRTTPTSTP